MPYLLNFLPKAAFPCIHARKVKIRKKTFFILGSDSSYLSLDNIYSNTVDLKSMTKIFRYDDIPTMHDAKISNSQSRSSSNILLQQKKNVENINISETISQKTHIRVLFSQTLQKTQIVS